MGPEEARPCPKEQNRTQQRSEVFPYSNTLMAKSLAQTLPSKSMMAKSEPHNKQHGDRGDQYYSWTPKTFEYLMYNVATRGH